MRPLPEMTVDEFLAWAADRPGRYELDGGEVVAMAPERARHARVKGAVYIALTRATRDAGLPCEALPDGMTVRADTRTAFEPDAVVSCGEPLPGDAIEVPEPVVVVEVLSPATAQRDIGAKLSGYFRRPSVRHYLIVDSERRLLIHHARGEGDWLATRILSEGTLALDPPGLAIDVGDLFAEA